MKNTLYNHHLVSMEFDKTNKKELFQSVAKLLEEKGFAKDSFFDSIYEREEKFPTGIMLKNIGIAIPHTEGEHVDEPSVVVTYCRKPITFQSMEDPSVSVPASFVIVLALKKPEEHLMFLSKLMEKFQEDSFMSQVALVQSSGEITEIIKHI